MWALSSRRAGRLLSCAAAALIGCALVGCPRLPARQARLVRVLVRDESTGPLAGILVEVDGIRTTSTGTDGSAAVSLGEQGAPRARVAVACPDPFRPAAPRHVARPLWEGAAALELTFVCRPRLRRVMVVARVRGGEGLTLRADGEPIGTIGMDGTLHAQLSRPPDSDLRLVLETGQRPLWPHSPAREFRLADRDELIVFEAQLQAAPRRGPAETSVRADAALEALPYAIRSNR